MSNKLFVAVLFAVLLAAVSSADASPAVTKDYLCAGCTLGTCYTGFEWC